MNVGLLRHIRYYLRKVNAYNAARFDYIRGRSDRQPPYARASRLLSYKLALNNRLEADKEASL